MQSRPAASDVERPLKASLSIEEMTRYVSRQCGTFFPDGSRIGSVVLTQGVEEAYRRLQVCLSATSLTRYRRNGEVYFDHLFSDSYLLFLCYLANSVWKISGERSLSSKIYCLNKALHSFDCMYDTVLPNVFLVIHGAGTMLGKAEIGEFFVIYQGCTVGASHGAYPKIGRGVSMTANSSIIGSAVVGDRSTIATRATVFQREVPPDHTVFIDDESGALTMKPSRTCYAQQVFGVNLRDL